MNVIEISLDDIDKSIYLQLFRKYKVISEEEITLLLAKIRGRGAKILK